MKLKVVIDDNKYVNWTYYDADTFDKIKLTPNINPFEHKLFSQDIFEYNNENNSVKLIHSIIRSYKNIAGVLLMNKTYSRTDNNKILYKCIPHDKKLPEFLIPITIKKSSFIKQTENKYVTFCFKNWNDKHPVGILCQTIGNTNNLINFFEYELYSKNLNISIKNFSNKTGLQLKNSETHHFIDKIMEKYKNIENRLNENIISIDPESCQDFDDAISFKELSINNYCISVYISNVAILLDYLNLWDSFSERISTIYLPDRKRPMLPSILSDNLCSLKSNESRFAICMDLFFNNETLINIKYTNVLIKVNENLTYEKANLHKCTLYNNILNFTRKICKKYRYLSDIKDSHDLVSYYMLFMNNKIAEFQEQYKNGIYRSVIKGQEPNLPSNLDKEISSFFKIFYSLSGQYSTYENKTKHLFLNSSETYLHITSPIRRLVDLLNLIKFQENLNEIQLNESANIFYNNWLNRLDYINTTMRSIKKVQNNCLILHKCATNKELLSEKHLGYLFDKIIRNDGLYQYSVYLVNLNTISKIILKDNYNNYFKTYFELYVFLSEYDLKKKIRLKMIE